MGDPLNTWQETVHNLIQTGTINPKAIAYRLHKATNYLSDICRRERVDPFAVCNEILKYSDQHFAHRDPPRHLRICSDVLNLLLDNTRWVAHYVEPEEGNPITYNKLCEQAGMLCEDLGGTIKSLARIEADGRIDEQDDVQIVECQHKITRLLTRLQALSVELRNRRCRGATP